jgi:branched-chain amino acid transport system substrate-binding protein
MNATNTTTFLILLMAGFLIAGCTEHAEKPTIKIGVALPLTGDASLWGQNAKNALLLAQNDINAKGGIDGKEIELIIEDTKCDPKEGVAAIQKLSDVDRTPIVIGDACSSVTLAMAPIAQERHVVLITPCSEAPAISNASEYVFRTWTPSDRQAKIMAVYARKQGINKIAILAINNNFGDSLADAFTKEFIASGGQIVANERYAPDERELNTQVAKINAADPEAVYLATYISDGVIAVRALRSSGSTAKLLGTTTIDNDEFYKPLGNLTEGLAFTNLQDTTTEEFKEEYVEAYNQTWPGAGGCASIAYDDFSLAADAIRHVGADPEKIKEYLAAVKDFPGVSGPITFDANRDLTRKHAVFMIKGGTRVLVED